MEAADYEKPGRFYLGKEYDKEKGAVREEALLYDSNDLVTHGVVLGMTGSGKTGLCMAILEEAAMDNVPAIVIDPKGDIANLMLTFPGLRGADFEPWVNADDARKKGISPGDHAEKTAEIWKRGLGEWGQDGGRIGVLREKVDVNVFTPGSTAGIPVSILSSLAAPEGEEWEDAEALGDRVGTTVMSLLSLVGISGDSIQSKEAVLLGAIFQAEWKAGRSLDLEQLIGKIQRPGFGKVGVIDLERFYPEKARQGLALKFNGLLASPGFSSWLEGAALDIGKMLHREDGKPRISIFSISHLGDAERMFFTSLLLNQMVGWMRGQNGTTSLRALFYMDEIFGFLPPTANPPSKRPMMTMLKQGRAYGLGCLLATQNPVDLDYKALSNIGTWFLGRLQTERDKARVLDGLEGVADAKFDRRSVDRLLSGLGSRVFLMHNVHEDGPVLFQTRWVMSYLAGPLTRRQIKELMDPKRGGFREAGGGDEVNPMAKRPVKAWANRPSVEAGVPEVFGEAEGGIYEAFLLREGTVHFSHLKSGGEGSRKVVKVNPLGKEGIEWDTWETLELEGLGSEPEEGVAFGELAGYAMSAGNYKTVMKEFSDELYREEREEIFHSPLVDLWGNIGEDEGGFRIRIAQKARERRDEAMDKLRETAGRKTATLETRMRAAEGRLSKEEAEAGAAKVQAGISVLGGIMKSVFGRKGGCFMGGRTSGTVLKATTAYKQHKDVEIAEDKIDGIRREIDAVKEELEEDLREIGRKFDPAALVLKKETLKPRRSDVIVERVGLLWK